MKSTWLLAAPLLVLTTARIGEAQTTKACIAASEKSTTLHRQDKLIEERRELVTCSAPSCPAVVKDECGKRLDDLSRALPTIVFQAKGANGEDVSAVKVTLDGKPFADKLDGSPLEVDPGDHTFVFEAAGLPPHSEHYVIRTGEKLRRETVSLTGASSPAPAAGGTQVNVGIGINGAPVAYGRLVVTAPHPGRVYIDDAVAGHTPLDLQSVPVGRHRVRVDFDEGGSSSTQRVFITSGETATIAATQSDAMLTFRSRAGGHFGLGAALQVSPLLKNAEFYGARLMPFLNFGLSPAVDIRLAAVANLGGGDREQGSGFALGFGGDVDFRFNLGATYTITVGVSGGVYLFPSGNCVFNGSGSETCTNTGYATYGWLTPEISPITLRFGADHQFEAGYVIGFGIVKDDPFLENLFAFSWIGPKLF